jgi:predicted TIM-barrel fold metal-dependent hydrolase
MEAPADFLINQMDYAGIDQAVLHNDHIYGSLNSFFAEAVQAYPDRLIGLAQVEEARAYEEDEIDKLHQAVTEFGLRGLYFTTATFFTTGYRHYYTDPIFTPFWDEVRKLALPVFWVFPTSSPIGDFKAEMAHFSNWYAAYPEVSSVLVHGLPENLFTDEHGRLALPGWITELLDHFPVSFELLYPLRWGGTWNYPYPKAHELIRQHYDRFGADKLHWGSDMPNVERYCTYGQTLSYFTQHCDFISEGDMKKILSENTLKLFTGPGA